MTKSALTSRPELVTSSLSLKRRWQNKLENGTQNAQGGKQIRKTTKISSGTKRWLQRNAKSYHIGVCSNNYHTIFVNTHIHCLYVCVCCVYVSSACLWVRVCAFANNSTSASVCVTEIEFNIRTRHPHKTYGKCSSAKMSSTNINDLVIVTQKDLHDLLEVFEKKSFEAVSFEEGTAVSCP